MVCEYNPLFLLQRRSEHDLLLGNGVYGIRRMLLLPLLLQVLMHVLLIQTEYVDLTGVLLD